MSSLGAPLGPRPGSARLGSARLGPARPERAPRRDPPPPDARAQPPATSVGLNLDKYNVFALMVAFAALHLLFPVFTDERAKERQRFVFFNGTPSFSV